MRRFLLLSILVLLLSGSATASPGDLQGTWDYHPGGKQFVLEIKNQSPGVYSGRYLVPQNPSTFRIRTYPGRKAGVLVEILQRDGSYTLIINAIMVDANTIQGAYVDVDGYHDQVTLKRR